MILIIILIVLIILYLTYYIKNSTRINNITEKMWCAQPSLVEKVTNSEYGLSSTQINDEGSDYLPLYFLDKPTKTISIYFPYLNIINMNNQLKIIDINTLIQIIPDYENKLYDILLNKKYEKIYNAIFDIKPLYQKLYNIFNAYVINRKNSTLQKDTDVKNKYIIKKQYNDTDYLYIVPFTYTITNINDIPIITKYNMIETTCKKDEEYIPCKIKITPDKKNYQIIDDMYYDDIVNYLSYLIFNDILELYILQNPDNIKQFQDILKKNNELREQIENILTVRVPLLF